MNNKPNPFSHLVSQLEETHLSGTRSNFEDPGFSALLDSYSILQQCALTHHLQSLLAPDPDRQPDSRGTKPPTPTFIAGTYLRTLNLLERTKSRLDRIAGRLDRKENQIESIQRDHASQFLLTELESGEKPARELIKLARSVGISERTLSRAKVELGILSIQRARPDPTNTLQTNRCWFWAVSSLPLSTQNSAPRTSPDPDSAPESPVRHNAMAM